MATKTQGRYISDLVVIKTKEFKEVKELLVASGIVSEDAEIVKNAGTILEITNALTDKQASQFIETLIAAKTPKRERVYSKRRVETTISALDDIKATIDDWGF